MVTMKITNNDPIGLYLTRIYVDNRTSDKVIIDVIENTNKAIKHFDSMPATAENCQRLQVYIKHYQALLAGRPDSDVKAEVDTQLTNLIDTLQTGIDREATPQTYTKPGTEKKGPDYGGMLKRAYDRWEVWGWKNRPIVTDTSKLEGYLRAIPGIVGMGYMNLIDKYTTDIIFKFFPPKPEDTKTHEDACKYVDKCVSIILQKFAYVQLTSERQTYQVIENQYDGAEELYEFAVSQGVEEAVEPATAGA